MGEEWRSLQSKPQEVSVSERLVSGKNVVTGKSRRDDRL